MRLPKRIVILGPESTGKSTLCTQLAQRFNTTWVPEFAREYLLTNGMDYTYEDLRIIAEGQISMEDRIAAEKGKNAVLFIDTDLYVMKVWSEFVYNRCDSHVLTGIAKRSYDLYLLCDTDLPWVKDKLREYPDLLSRRKLFFHYKEAMESQSVPWEIISGTYEQRLEKAVAAVKKHIIT